MDPIASTGPLARPYQVSSPRIGLYTLIEYGFYWSVFYSYFGDVLFHIPLMGIGFIFFMAGLCFVRSGSQGIFKVALACPFLFTASFVAAQKIHGESLGDGTVRSVLVWALFIIILNKLIGRPGFVQRFPVALLCMGLCTVPFIGFTGEGRAGLTIKAGMLGNPNGLSVFFGFLAIAFTVRGLEARRPRARFLHMAIALFSLFIVGLTVSRGPLLGYAVALVVAFRRSLRRAFVPLLILVVLGGGAFALGVFDRTLESYSERITVDSGRGELNTNALAKFSQSPLTGVGLSHVGVEMRGREELIVPHNGPLFVALSSGIIPLLFFLGYWATGLAGALKASPQNPIYPYLLPLWSYACFNEQLGMGFMYEWSCFSVCICLVQLIPKHPARLFRRQPAQNRPEGPRIPVVKSVWTRQ